MQTIIYLSRHGETVNNELSKKTGAYWKSEWANIPHLKSLTKLGIRQATILANYLKQFEIEPNQTPREDIIIFGSFLDRSIATCSILQHILNIPYDQIYKSILLNEEVPREYAPKDINKNPKAKEWWARKKTKDEITKTVISEFQEIIKRFKGKSIISPLHGNINSLILEHLNIPCEEFGNCGLVKIGYEHGKVSTITPYQSNGDLEKAISEKKT